MCSFDAPGFPIRHLTRAEFQKGKDAYDYSQGIGRYDARKLEAVLQSIGVILPMDLDLLGYMESVAPIGGAIQGTPSFPLMEFLLLMDKIKGDWLAKRKEDTDMLDAFVAMGGRNDKSGHVEIGILKETIQVCCCIGGVLSLSLNPPPLFPPCVRGVLRAVCSVV